MTVKAVSADWAAAGSADPQNSRAEHLFPTAEALSVRFRRRARAAEDLDCLPPSRGRHCDSLAYRTKRPFAVNAPTSPGAQLTSGDDRSSDFSR
ncbi:hypothetical protein XFF6990_390105 [Xanthomonas citri pv. fuscans]|nr:hypothetical protein XFF6990_390105 [Xanthomonas citri pv. fuscans]